MSFLFYLHLISSMLFQIHTCIHRNLWYEMLQILHMRPLTDFKDLSTSTYTIDLEHPP